MDNNFLEVCDVYKDCAKTFVLPFDGYHSPLCMIMPEDFHSPWKTSSKICHSCCEKTIISTLTKSVSYLSMPVDADEKVRHFVFVMKELADNSFMYTLAAIYSTVKTFEMNFGDRSQICQKTFAEKSFEERFAYYTKVELEISTKAKKRWTGNTN